MHFFFWAVGHAHDRVAERRSGRHGHHSHGNAHDEDFVGHNLVAIECWISPKNSNGWRLRGELLLLIWPILKREQSAKM